jgi:hypothetical protein
MIELCIALVSILAICGGLLQLTSLTHLQTKALFDARKHCAEHVFLDSPPAGSPDFIGLRQTGPDGKPLTADDTFAAADRAQFAATVAAKAVEDSADWELIGRSPNNSLLALRDNIEPEHVFGLVGGEASETIDLLPVVQHLLYSKRSITTEANVWLTWTRGIY